jgi:ABC-type lipopolysaccharide export system ATPase subunit
MVGPFRGRIVDQRTPECQRWPPGAGDIVARIARLRLTVAANEGGVVENGRYVARLPPRERARFGVAHVSEGRRVFPSLSVRDNVQRAYLGG